MTGAYRFVLRETGGPEVLQAEQIELDDPNEHELRIRHEAVGLNFIDTYHRSGLYPLPLPSGIGTEAAGVVEGVGAGVVGFGKGDRVAYFSGSLGAYASHRLIDAARVVKLPDSIGTDVAAAVMLKGCTAEFLVERCARVEAGDTVLVHAAAGGVGSILVPWLKSRGAIVIGHSGSSAKAAMVSSLGADHSLCCPMDELAEEVRVLTHGTGVAVVLDGVGATSWSASLNAVARRGLVVTYGNASGPVPPFTALDLLKAGSVFVTRPTLFDYIPTPDALRASADRVFEMIAAETIRVKIGQTFPLLEASEAHRAIEARATTGSTILLS